MGLFFKKYFFLFILLFSIQSLFAYDSGYEILDYDFKGVVTKDNTVSCVETIKVNFTEESHGIYRTIPKFMEITLPVNGEDRHFFYRTKVRFFNSVTDKWQPDSTNEYASYKMGESWRTFTGEHTYILKYDYVMPKDGVPDMDFFFFSPLGFSWWAEIHNFSFDLDFNDGFPEDFSPEEEITLYSGPFGGKENKLGVTYRIEGNHIKGSASDIPERNAITVYMELPDNYFSEAKRDIQYFPLFCIAVIIITAFISVIRMSKKTKVVSTVEFYPPEGINSVEVGYIVDGYTQDTDVISLIPYLANKGYLQILKGKEKKKKETKDDKKNEKKNDYYTVMKLKDIDPSEKSYVKDFFNYLFGSSKKKKLANLDYTFFDSINSVRDGVSKTFSGEKQLYSTLKGLPLILMNLFLGLFCATCNQIGGLENLEIGIIIFLIEFGIVAFRFEYSKNQYLSKKSGLAVRIICMTLVTLVLMGAMDVLAKSSRYPLYVFAMLLFGGEIINFYSYRFTKLTRYGAELIGKLLGLKQFIKTAEVQKLEKLSKENPDYFYDILPYAMVFGLTDYWSKQFSSILKGTPKWYEEAENEVFDVLSFGNHFSKAMKKSVDEYNQKVSSSSYGYSSSYRSSSSRGYSGGGGGGGGGGRW